MPWDRRAELLDIEAQAADHAAAMRAEARHERNTDRWPEPNWDRPTSAEAEADEWYLNGGAA
jgi:hypothetical protein